MLNVADFYVPRHFSLYTDLYGFQSRGVTTKLEIHNVLHCCHRQTNQATVTCNMYRKFAEILICGFKICKQTDN